MAQALGELRLSAYASDILAQACRPYPGLPCLGPRLKISPVPDAPQHFVEVVLMSLAWRVFEPFVIQGEALHQILA